MNQKRAHLYVEGRDDKFAILGLLERHGIDCHDKTRAFDVHTSQGLNEQGTESVEALLEGMDYAIRQSRGRPTGFVFDADQNLQTRWQSISDRLRSTGFDWPQIPDTGGTIRSANIQGQESTVGVWLMPNNVDSGMLEHFLQGLIVVGDKLLPLAKEATTTVMSTERRFSEFHETKAVVHTWLAWQEKPGLPFGTAITAHYLCHDTPTALAFVDWFRKLFGLESTMVP